MISGSIPIDGLPYLHASRYCQSDWLARLANRPFGGAWYLFDPTRLVALDGLVRIGARREAESGVPKVWITGPVRGPELTVPAVSTKAG